MPIDFNSFRSMASESPNKAIYLQGDTVKATGNAASKSVDKFQAATRAFIDVCRTRYGAAMGEALSRHLQDDLAAGKPLTARKIKALIAFADERMGSATSVDAGGKAIDLAKLGTDKMKRVGIRQSTKLAKAAAGQQETAAATLAAFKFGKDAKVDLAAMLRHLATFHVYIDREVAARKLSVVTIAAPLAEPNAPADVPRAPESAQQVSDAEFMATKLFEKGLFTAIDAMDNKELSDVYQGLISGGTDKFRKELTRIINHPDATGEARRLAERAFSDICRIEAMVVSEISRRMILDQTPDSQKANVPSLMERYAGDSPAATISAAKRT